MRKLSACIAVLLFLMTGCQGEAPTGPSPAKSAEAGAESVQGNAAQETGREHDEAQKGTTPVEGSPDVLISDPGTWDHPVKSVFANHRVSMEKVILQQNRTYPVFYVELPFDAKEAANRAEMLKLLGELARANSYWDFRIMDTRRQLQIDVACDRTRKTIASTVVNGKMLAQDAGEIPAEDRETGNGGFAAYLAKASNKTEKLDVKARGDLDGDGTEELIAAYMGRNYVVKQQGNAYLNSGELADPIEAIDHANVSVSIQPLTKGHERYIVVNAENGDEARGFSVYRLVKGRPELVMYNYPDATNSGERLLKDVDGDGISDSVSVYRYHDFQQHVVTVYEPFNRSKPETWKLSYENEKGVFMHPEAAVDVVRNWIDDMKNQDYLESEIRQLASTSQAQTFPAAKHLNLGQGGDELAYVTESETGSGALIRVEGGPEGGSLYFTLQPSEHRWKITAVSSQAPL
ncbi:hypothetical protein ACTHPF_18885 [Paenibacillus sp. SAF-054]|uniref:hypothetical protein n=1 Tax=Paenibacillus sp. SAF-054 TaxID=3436863 RepID=UPI003F81D105